METRPRPKVRVRLSKGGGAGPARLLNKEHLELPEYSRVGPGAWVGYAFRRCLRRLPRSREESFKAKSVCSR